jgi:glucosamine-6-phosphate deaminase
MSESTVESSLQPEKTFFVDKLQVEIYADRATSGRAAAAYTASILQQAIAQNGAARGLFAAGPSQNDLLANLSLDNSVDWGKLTAFHLDDYVGMSGDAPQSFQTYLKENLFNRVKPGQVHYINGMAPDPQAEAVRYGKLLQEGEQDVACIGIGENGHLAFNDPPLADFNDPQNVRVVDLVESCRVQQIHDGCFPELDLVPRQALTVTIPPILAAKRIVCVVPGPTKAKVVYESLMGPVTSLCPGSILRQYATARLFLDRQSAALLQV